jgi:enoyl-CoA hydratase/carnithine racemase
MTSILTIDYPETYNIHLNRPLSLNCISLDMISSIRSTIKEKNKTVVFTGEGKAFCAGGDIISLYQKKFSSKEFYFNTCNLFFEVYCMAQDRIAILDGITIGSGVALGMVSSHPVLTHKTLWSMPETAVGHITDVGSTYFLSRLCSEEVGAYLGLTGHRLTGIDCYYAGISNLYIPQMSSSIKSQILNEGTQGIFRNCITPDSSKSKLLRDLPMINQCFNLNFDVQTIFNRLSSVNNEWSLEVLKNLRQMCPLSLKLVHQMIKRPKNLSFFQILEADYNLALRIIAQNPWNLTRCIEHKLIKKSKDKINWSPENLYDISDRVVQEFFENHHHKLIDHKL